MAHISFACPAGPKCWRLNKSIQHPGKFFFSILYDFFKPSELCKIFPQNAGNGISETLDFKIFLGGACPLMPLDARPFPNPGYVPGSNAPNGTECT